MSVKQKQARERQKAYYDQQLRDRLAFLSEKGITADRADKDPIVRKLKADVRAAAGRLRVIAAHEKKTEELAKMKAEKAAAPRIEQEAGKSDKPKKAPEEGKGKKAKPEKKASPSKAPEGGKSRKTEESPEAGKATAGKKGDE